MSDAGTESSETVDYRDDPNATLTLLNQLDTGDRVHITADAAVLADKDDRSNLFERGDLFFDDTATVIDIDSGRITVKLDEQGVNAASGPYATNEFELGTESLYPCWKPTAEASEEEKRWRPIQTPVAFLNSIERLNE